MGIPEFEAKTGYKFKDKSILENALCHSSSCGVGTKTFDRMEYLGDAVLELVVSAFLYAAFPDYEEGKLTKVRTGIVSEGALSRAAKETGLSGIIRLGKGEELTGGREKPSILSDAFEAVTAAVYLDGGIDAATDFVLRCLKDIIQESVKQGGVADYKTHLQEHLQKSSPSPIEYRTREAEGSGFNFYSEVFHKGKMIGSGYGNRKKDAEQQAAKAALER